MEVIGSILSSLNFETTTFFCQVILFFVMHYTMNWLVYQPIMQIRDARDAKIAQGLAEAEAAAAEARRLKEDYEEKVRGARAEGQAAIQKATDAAEADRKARLEAARDKAAGILQQARAEAEDALAKAEETLETQATQVAQAIAKKLLASSLDDSDCKAVLSKMGGAS